VVLLFVGFCFGYLADFRFRGFDALPSCHAGPLIRRAGTTGRRAGTTGRRAGTTGRRARTTGRRAGTDTTPTSRDDRTSSRDMYCMYCMDCMYFNFFSSRGNKREWRESLLAIIHVLHSRAGTTEKVNSLLPLLVEPGRNTTVEPGPFDGRAGPFRGSSRAFSRL
jgi:hypothetical protein